MFGAAILGLTTPLRICTVSTCGRNGGQAFCDAVQTLSAGTDIGDARIEGPDAGTAVARFDGTSRRGRRPQMRGREDEGFTSGWLFTSQRL